MRLLLTLALCAPTFLCAEEVTVDTFVRAESDFNIRANMEAFGYDLESCITCATPLRRTTSLLSA